ncbi:AAA family ATPase, partial [Clostridium sp. AL.422]|uniref:McrB family protein n=1 Tax=Clostridium TaxID=1485 RepID=UPI00293DD233
YSRNLKVIYPILIEVDKNSEELNSKEFKLRYYRDKVITINNKDYYITNDWYDSDKRNNKFEFVRWIRNKIYNSVYKIKEVNTNAYEVRDEMKMLPIKGLTLELDNILKRKKQVILYGPPGTGKTYNAEKISFELSARNIYKKSFEFLNEEEKEIIKGNSENKGYVRFSCFHPNYSYEDFIEGIKPKVINGQTVFEERDGVFKSICTDAQNNKEKNYYLIIDEINRGDISRIFGELIMLIEKSKRGKEIILPLSNTLFSVPDNLYIIGTMNTADRSISALDIALRRRFGFKELMTDYKLLEGITFKSLPLDKWLKEFNNRIIENLGNEARNLQIGHSYFIENEKPISDIERFREIIKEDIIPLIDEYCYGDYSLMAKIFGNSIINVKEQSVNEKIFEASNPLEFIEALIEPCIEIRIEDSVEDLDEYSNKEEISDEDAERDRI